jgi:Carboxypeptidase regulatory-like domain
MKSLASVLFALLVPSAVFAQASGAISGTVTASQGGGPLPGATVRVRNTATGTTSVAQTAANGSYTLASLPPGSYDLSVDPPPLFIPNQRKNIAVAAGQTVRVDVALDDVSFGTLGDGGADFQKLLAPPPAPTGPAPRTPDGRPDLGGVWLPALPRVAVAPKPLPWAAKLARERQENFAKDIPSAHCLPLGVTFTGFIFPMKFVQTPALIVVMDEANPTRQIFLDGRPHPKDLNPSFMGHSVGRWEGDTLVVDTVGLNDRTWAEIGGLPHTEKLHVVERFRRVDLGHLETQITIDDPGAFENTWVMKKVTSLAPKDFELLEFVCAENDRDREHLVGK